MKSFRNLLFTSFLACSASLTVVSRAANLVVSNTASTPVATLLQQGDALEHHGKVLAAIALYKAAEKMAPQNPEILVRLSEAYSDSIDDAPQTDAKQNAHAAFHYAKRATQLAPKNSRAHVDLAIAFGRMTDFVGNKTKIEYSRFIRDEAKKAISLDPKNDLAWHVLGRWNSGIASVSPILKFFVKIIYGELPEASNEEAARCLERAVKLAPNRILNHTELAQVYETLGKKTAAQREWKHALALTPDDQADRDAQQKAREALGK